MRRALFAPALAVALAGCAPQGRWGNEARYAPDLHGYVIARALESDDCLVLVSPVTRKKLRCREDVEPLLAPLTRAAGNAVGDFSVGLEVAAPVTVGMLPLAASGLLLSLPGAMLGAVPDIAYEVASSPGAKTLYERGRTAYAMDREGQAERLLELAALKAAGADPKDHVVRADYLLGILYQREGRPRDAARAFQAFVERALFRDEAAYADAEARLQALDPGALRPCRSRAPITFSWPR